MCIFRMATGNGTRTVSESDFFTQNVADVTFDNDNNDEDDIEMIKIEIHSDDAVEHILEPSGNQTSSVRGRVPLDVRQQIVGKLSSFIIVGKLLPCI